MNKSIICLILLLLTSCSTTNSNIFKIIDKNHPLLKDIFDKSEKYEVQIRYTQINRDKKGNPTFKSINYSVVTTHYFYPASTVKMPAAFLALEKINEINTLNNTKIDENTTIINHSHEPPYLGAFQDSTNFSNLPTLGHYIDKLFVVSDNDAYNRIYEFLGQDYLNEKHQEKGIFTNSRIIHRVGVSGFNFKNHQFTNAVSFLNQNKDTIISLAANVAKLNPIKNLKNTHKGIGYYVDSTAKIVYEPFDFSKKNFLNLIDLENSLKRIVFPNNFSQKERYNLTNDQYEFLYKSMLKLPREFDYLKKDKSTTYEDGYCKYFIFGDTKNEIPPHIKILNKIGTAYGTVTDCAFIYDTKNKVEFFLTATILVNENKIFNDGKYEYETIGIPFLAELGRQIYNHELKRDKKYKFKGERPMDLE